MVIEFEESMEPDLNLPFDWVRDYVRDYVLDCYSLVLG